jgi:cation diffusion facilitator CzcD-associated flavoprotein CzcO
MKTPALHPVEVEQAINLDAVIIGAGFSGMYQLLSLRDKLGMQVKVLEAAGGVGGTWYWNRYPGARCDSESHSYMFYFSKELVNEWAWTERYPQQPEILRYLNHVADRFSLRSDILLNTRMHSAHFDAATNHWHVYTEQGQHFVAPFLITAVGCLSSANVPQVPGLSDFQGQWYHTGQWPHEGVDFTGKRVGVVGTGSTGIQTIPVVAAQAHHLTVFQRTANYSIPARNALLSEEFKRFAKTHAEGIRHIMNTNTNGHPFRMVNRSVTATYPAEREAIMETAWIKGGLEFRAAFNDTLINPESNQLVADFIRKKIRDIVLKPEVAELLSDIDHPFAAKRPPVDSHYFETYNRDNVSLVDLRATPIERITAKGIQTAQAEYPLDILIFATGFDAMTGSLLKMDIQGRDGHQLKQVWRDGPRNYLGLQVPGFPNMFTITGPGSPSVLSNLPPAIEQHVNWITDCIRMLRDKGLQRIEASEQASDGWCEEVNKAANATLLAQVKHSWYWGANVPGKPQVFMPYAGGFARYTEICNQVVSDNYRGFELST